MGRGPRRNPDPPMAKPRDLPSEVENEGQGGESPGGEGSDLASACQAEQELDFVIKSGRPLKVGDPITLRTGSPVAVIGAEGQELGNLDEDASRRIRSCINFGYRMVGSITAFDPPTGSGTVLIHGERGQ